ncbi:MAG TPA: MDR family MFS transporter [Candidatus Dormibacteraeota bacterium]|nr:MDR family MFS transporter [Candidatus Dormibacteraeota bacterium]
MTAAPARLPWTPDLVRVMAGLMLSLFVAAMDSTVVGTALPTIARELGQFQLYPWVFSGYLITATTTVPVWGRLADRYGRRLVLLLGIAIFVVASMLCAASPGMAALIAFRTLQGVGAGCIQPVVFTLVGDIFPLPQRARLQGFFSSMWAIAAVIGPALGALFVSTIGWRWIFLINLPIGLIAGGLIYGHREKRPEQVAASGIDVRSVVLLTGGIALLLWGLGTGSPTASPVWWAIAAAAVMLVAFAWVEARGRAPLLPLDLLRHPVIGPAILVGAIAGTVMFGVTAYVPLYVQEVLGGTPYAAGVAVGAMSIGWPIASATAGFIMVRVGYQRLVVAGAVALLAGSLMLALEPPGAGVLWVSAGSLVIGVGMGLFTAPLLIVIQASVAWGRRGAATALNQFSRTIGGAIGVSLMGVLLQVFLGSARDPLAAHAQLAAGLRADFAVVGGLSACVLAVALVILRTAKTEAPERAPLRATD